MPSKEWRKNNADKLREYRREWYHRNKTAAKSSVKSNREERKEWLYDLKSQMKCLSCPENDVACLDFHHRDPEEKSGTISESITRKGWSKERILEEIAKCDVLCANCHRKLHYYRTRSG